MPYIFIEEESLTQKVLLCMYYVKYALHLCRAKVEIIHLESCKFRAIQPQNAGKSFIAWWEGIREIDERLWNIHEFVPKSSDDVLTSKNDLIK